MQEKVALNGLWWKSLQGFQYFLKMLLVSSKITLYHSLQNPSELQEEAIWKNDSQEDILKWGKKTTPFSAAEKPQRISSSFLFQPCQDLQRHLELSCPWNAVESIWNTLGLVFSSPINIIQACWSMKLGWAWSFLRRIFLSWKQSLVALLWCSPQLIYFEPHQFIYGIITTSFWLTIPLMIQPIVNSRLLRRSLQ